jgi:hypothetical protein
MTAPDQCCRNVRKFLPGDMNIAVCVLPGTELTFADEVRCLPTGLLACSERVTPQKAGKTTTFKSAR